MPAIDVTAIEGFAEMTAEQKVEALLKLDVPEQVDLSGYIPKTQFDKTASELADAKKAIKSKMTADEAAAAEREAKWAEMEAKLATLEQEKLESSYKASYLALGYEDKLAEETAKAMVAGDMKKVFENQKKAAEAAEKRIRAELTRQDPRHDGAGGGTEQEKSEAVKIAERIAEGRAAEAVKARDILSRYIK